MKQTFALPHENWDAVMERLHWCAQTFGPRVFSGTWEYNAVHHNVVIIGEKNILLYQLRWS